MIQQEFNELWVDIYRPQKIDDFILNSETKKIFENFIKTKTLTNMTFIGTPGIGKTALALMLANELDADTLFIPCAIEGGIDTLRTKITQFVKAYSEKLKIVILDELDSASASQDSSFQKGLRNLIEMSKDTRFICTANYNKIIPAVLSRCPPINISFNTKDIILRIENILKIEKVKYSEKDISEIINVINFHFPDIRSILTSVQRQIKDNKFIFTKNIGIIENSESIISEIFENIKTQKLLDIRRNYITKLGKSADYLILAGELFNAVLENDLIDNPEYLRRLTQCIYEANVCVDKEISFFGMICIIYAILKK